MSRKISRLHAGADVTAQWELHLHVRALWYSLMEIVRMVHEVNSDLRRLAEGAQHCWSSCGRYGIFRPAVHVANALCLGGGIRLDLESVHAYLMLHFLQRQHPISSRRRNRSKPKPWLRSPGPISLEPTMEQRGKESVSKQQGESNKHSTRVDRDQTIKATRNDEQEARTISSSMACGKRHAKTAEQFPNNWRNKFT